MRSTPSPVWEKAFIVIHYARNLAALLNYCYPSRLIPAPNHVLWHADRRSAQGWRSQTEGEIFKGTDGACADPDTRIFPATGHKTAVLPPILIQLTFTSHTAFFGTFLDSKKVPSLLVPLVLFFRDCAAADFVVYYKLVCLVRARAAAITLGMISIGENRYAV